MKRIIKKAALVLLLFLLMACKEEEIMTEEEPYREGKIQFAKDYSEVTQDHSYRMIDAERGLEILERGTGIVYFGFPDCPWCQAYVPLLQDAVSSYSDLPIWYVDIQKDREENSEAYQRITEFGKEYFKLDQEGEPRIFVPFVFFVKNGEIIMTDDETSVMDEEVTPEEYWTEEKKSEFKIKIYEGLTAIGEDCGSCN